MYFEFNKAVSKSTFKRKSYKHPIRCNSLMITESVNVEPVEFEKVLNQVFLRGSKIFWHSCLTELKNVSILLEKNEF